MSSRECLLVDGRKEKYFLREREDDKRSRMVGAVSCLCMDGLKKEEMSSMAQSAVVRSNKSSGVFRKGQGLGRPLGLSHSHAVIPLIRTTRS
jgi:hypothetical protein